MTTRLHRSIEKKLEENQPYDASQMVKTLYARACNKGSFHEAADMAFDFALKFAQKELYTIAADFGMMMVQAWENACTSNASVGEIEMDGSSAQSVQSSRAAFFSHEDRRQKIQTVLSACPPKSSKDKFKFVERAVKNSISDEVPDGDPGLHKLAGEAYLSEEEYGKAQLHLVFCGDVQLLLALLAAWKAKCYASERDLLVLRLVLVLLSMKDVATADALVREYADLDAPFVDPPLQFAYLLVEACKQQQVGFYKHIKTKYTLVLRRDPAFSECLAVIEAVCLGMEEQRGAGGGLGNLMGMVSNLMRNLNETAEEDP
uniref:Uncharacterized protein n=1 Tax=Chromera velia CCMP2878 TaxID=1169474 RepID=A0A0G4GP14_9ALVE|eukprot:Cvel_22750.t1-p1 / transcript=Cvel_22750.t1 / gene=Cvel_22750 / organism=Chromera_velia_CCMP2878 / gene_product=Golgi to ER traffic protein 4 homolog, putative / transcript_product=Golgi to ER traffic protein 4 homolog, putative / location=Cvel_scaffold2270:11797-14386(+) / protein_length=316 / sequence_SO=supercontig / SO=protein_coding / is_pseudo=false